MKMLEAVATKGPVRWAAWAILNRHDRGLLDDVAQTVVLKYLRNHDAEEEMPRAYWLLAGKRVAIDLAVKESRFPRNVIDVENEQPINRRVALLSDPFNVEAWMTLREIASLPVGRVAIGLVLKQNSGAVLAPYERLRLYRARKQLRKVALAR